MTLLGIKGVQFDLTAPAVWTRKLLPFKQRVDSGENKSICAQERRTGGILMISYILPAQDGNSAKERLLETIALLEKEGIDGKAFEITADCRLMKYSNSSS